MAVQGTSLDQTIRLAQLSSANQPSADAQKSKFSSILAANLMTTALLSGGSAAGAPADASGDLLSGLLDSEDGLKTALLLLCTMMSSDSNSSVNAMLVRLAGAVSGLPEESQTALRSQVLAGNAGGTVLEKVDNQVFGNTAGAAIPYQASKPVSPVVTSNVNNRSASLYRSVIDQFSVETNPRYKVNKNGNDETYCNIFMWDVTRAMGAEIPHYVDPKTLAPVQYPDTRGARELTANGIYDWLGKVGSQYGWYSVTAEQAQNLANQGKPVVTAMRNAGGHGHVQVVSPSLDRQYNSARGVMIAQAGSHLYNYAPITSVYRASLPKVVYYAHA